MIKHRTLNIKIILKNILIFQTDFCSIKIKERFSKTILKNYFLELFSKIVIK